MNIHAVGDNIKHLCKRKGMTLQILADLIGVGDSTLSNWCSGKRQITAYGLLRVSRVLGTTMERLMEGIEDEKYLPKEYVPDTNVGELISRQAALVAVKDALMAWSYMPKWRDEKILEAIAELPSAQPEIIYCKDCGHRDDHGCCKYWKGLSMGEIPIATDDNDFCSHARRREREH